MKQSNLLSVIAAGLLFVTGLTSSDAQAGEMLDEKNGIFSFASRTFDVDKDLAKVSHAVDEGSFWLTNVDWIRSLVRSDPYLSSTTILMNDRSDWPGISLWIPDDDSRLTPVGDVNRLFDVPSYELFWRGVSPKTPIGSGNIFLVPKVRSDVFYAGCGMTHATATPIFCSILIRYPPDPKIFITIRIFKISDPLNDFTEIFRRVEALLNCLDVTEEPVSGETRPAPNSISVEDISIRGRCRVPEIS